MTEQKKLTRKYIEVSDIVNPRKFMSLWGLEAHEATKIIPSDEDTIMKNIAATMDISDTTASELAEVCGKETLFTGTEPKKKDNLYRMNEQPPGEQLQCLKYQLESNTKRCAKPAFDTLVKTQFKYSAKDTDLTVRPEEHNLRVVEPEFRVPTPNVILCVEVTKCKIYGVHTNMQKEKDAFLVLGTQPLTDLRDRLQCSADNIIPGDYSAMPDVDSKQLVTMGEMFKSSFFFIEDVFYNDTREADHTDYSKPIITWAKKHMPDKNFTTKPMSERQFFDLDIKLGKYYVFQHQGNCEHAVKFSDVRLFNAIDVQDVRLYPVRTKTRFRTRLVCQACFTISSKWSVSNSPLLPSEPTLLCALCFKSLMFKPDGTKISDFQAFHFNS